LTLAQQALNKLRLEHHDVRYEMVAKPGDVLQV